MKKLCGGLIIIGLLFTLSTTAFGLPSGELIGTFDGNDNDSSLVQAKIEEWAAGEGIEIDLTNFELYEKFEVDENETEGSNPLDLDYTEKKDGNEPISGTWNSGDTAISFYSIKAGTSWELYWLETAATSGMWTTTNTLGGKGLSHFSAWKSDVKPPPPSTAIPEPSTVLLRGAGLLVLVGLGRKRLKK
jgi:hypothetical protein